VKHERSNLEVQQTDVLNGDKDGGNVILTAKLHIMPNQKYVDMYSHIMHIHFYVRINGGEATWSV
jgi:hypothetical protein